MKINKEELKLISEYLKLRETKRSVVENRKYEDAARIRDKERQILGEIIKISDQNYTSYQHYESELRIYLLKEFGINIDSDNSFYLIRESIINKIID